MFDYSWRTRRESSWGRSAEKLHDDNSGKSSHQDEDDLFEGRLHLQPLLDAEFSLENVTSKEIDLKNYLLAESSNRQSLAGRGSSRSSEKSSAEHS